MKIKILNKNFLFVLLADTLLIATSWYCAHLLRFNFQIPEGIPGLSFRVIPLIIFIKIISFYFFDVYQGMWRYTGLEDLINILKASISSSFLIFIPIFTHFGPPAIACKRIMC